MPVGREAIALAMLLGVCACTDDDRPPVQATGTYLSYAAEDDLGLCPATVTYAEQWMAVAAEQMGLDATQLPKMTYYRVDWRSEKGECGEEAAGCAQWEGERIAMFGAMPIDKHELVHALHMSAWPNQSAMLEEGLAHAYDDWFPGLALFAPSSADMFDAAVVVTREQDVGLAMNTGAFLLISLARRHGPEAVARLWNGSHYPTTAAEFRADFEREIGEPLDTFLAEVDHYTCQIVSCVGEPKPWVDGVWTTRSPVGCDDHTIGSIGSEYSVRRTEIVRIEEFGDYEISVSDTPWGVAITSCDDACMYDGLISVGGNETYLAYMIPGTYRFETTQMSPDDPAYTVELRRAP